MNFFPINRSEENRIHYTKRILVSLADNQLFWKAVKPPLFYKVAGKDKTHLIENNELVKTEQETAEGLKNIFPNIVQTPDSSSYSNDEALVSNTNVATLKAILKYRNHPSIIAVQNKYRDMGNFNFIEVHQKQKRDFKAICKLGITKLYYPNKCFKRKNQYFSKFLCNGFSNSIKVSTFTEILKQADVTPLY